MKPLTTFDILNLTQEQKMKGVWFSGILGEGEYKRWWSNGQLQIHTFYKEDERHGEYKEWYDNGKLKCHCFYKDGEQDGEYKRWYDTGQLEIHSFYKDGELDGGHRKWFLMVN